MTGEVPQNYVFPSISLVHKISQSSVHRHCLWISMIRFTSTRRLRYLVKKNSQWQTHFSYYKHGPHAGQFHRNLTRIRLCHTMRPFADWNIFSSCEHCVVSPTAHVKTADIGSWGILHNVRMMVDVMSKDALIDHYSDIVGNQLSGVGFTDLNTNAPPPPPPPPPHTHTHTHTHTY